MSYRACLVRSVGIRREEGAGIHPCDVHGASHRRGSQFDHRESLWAEWPAVLGVDCSRVARRRPEIGGGHAGRQYQRTSRWPNGRGPSREVGHIGRGRFRSTRDIGA